MFRLYLETMIHLKPIQVVYQVLTKVYRPRLKPAVAPIHQHPISIVQPIWKHPVSLSEHGRLSEYHHHYMDEIGQEGMSVSDCEQRIDAYMTELPQQSVGQEPYPTSLRVMNWIKFFVQHRESRNQKREDSLYAQVLLLEKELEYRLLGNHLLENAFSLFVASLYFEDKRLYHKTLRLLRKELDEQILSDGAHFEQSPMYHCILLDRLLDCLNFLRHAGIFDGSSEFSQYLSQKAQLMLGHLQAVIWENQQIPLLNDAVYGIAPSANDIFDYAQRLELVWQEIPMKACGYRKMKNASMEAIVDVGDVQAAYQPGHTHADTLTYELRVEGKPFVVDTGCSTYEKTARRQFERGSEAHNVVVVNHQDSSHVWGGFRVGRRASVSLKSNNPHVLEASHNGYGKPCRRRFEMKEGAFVVEDYYDGEAVSLIHLAEGTDQRRIEIDGASEIVIENGKYSTMFEHFHNGQVMKLRFRGHLKYTIR